MNFLCKFSKFGIIFFYAASFIQSDFNTLSAQNKELGLAYIQDITPFSSPDISRYNSIVQDPKGYLFIGGNNGLLSYNGSHWQQLNLPGPVSVCNGPDGKIIAYGKNFFGIIEYTPDDSVNLSRLYNTENNNDNKVGTIIKIWSLHENIILQTSSGIFTWNNDKLNPLTIPGLPGTIINGICEGRSGNLWVLYDFNLSRIEWPSAFSFFDSRNGLSGTVNDITRFKEHLYASTSKGIFILETKDQNDSDFATPEFKLIENSGLNCGQLLNCGNILLGISEKGILKITDDRAVKVYTGIINILFQLKTDSETVLAGTENGMVKLDLSSAKFNSSPVALNFSLPVRDIEMTTSNYLWIISGSGGLLRFPLAKGLTDSMTYNSYDSTNGLPGKNSLITMLETDNKLLISTNRGFFYYDESSDRFFPYSPLRYNAIAGNDIILTPVSKDYENNLWLKAIRQKSNETEIWKARYCTTDSFELSPFNVIRFKDSPVRSLYSEPDGIIWIGTPDNLIRYDSKESGVSVQNISAHINKINIGDRYSIIPDPNMPQNDQVESRPVTLRYSKNSLRFDYISTVHSDKEKALFQYYLDGYNKDWSEWSAQNFISFCHLEPGTYTFRVRVQDMFGNVSVPDNFTFRISGPLLLKWWAILIYLMILLLAVFFLRKWKIYNDLKNRYKLEEIINERTEALLKEKEKSESLIANILPKNTADELKSTGKATSSKYKMVTVLFADIQGFTKIAEQMNPEKLIDELDRFYFQFDSVVEKYNIEKIKTIGDAYMAAGGIPVKNRTNPVEVVLAALQMQHYMKELKKTKADIWDLRIGIHTGSVIAGVIGQKKFSYDIWGDTVNTASRMESSGEIGKVNISTTTYDLIKDFFKCQYRGKMPVKYKGDIEMYFVSGIKPEFQSEDELTPNEEFKIHLQVLRLLDLEEFIMQRLKNELPQTLYFHNAQHTSHVHYQAELLGRSENISSAELLLIRTAALCHDIGYIYKVDGHEEKSVEMAREILPVYMYTEDQIKQICKLILATRMPPDPSNLMEKILIDANFDHIGRVDFLIESDRLFQEYRTLGIAGTKKEWNELQINFLKNFDFFTSAGQKMREVSREQQIENIIKFS
jgi:adenylate cyclase